MRNDQPAKRGPEMTRLLARLFPADPSKPRLVNFNVTWGPVYAATVEGRAAAINHVLDMHERGETVLVTPEEINHGQ